MTIEVKPAHGFEDMATMFAPKDPHLDDLPVWSLWCIRVRPGFRKRGITAALIIISVVGLLGASLLFGGLILLSGAAALLCGSPAGEYGALADAHVSPWSATSSTRSATGAQTLSGSTRFPHTTGHLAATR